MIAATSRATPDGRDREFRAHARREHGARRRRGPGPLNDREADDLLSQLAPGELAPEAKREVIGRAEGNPLYLEHLLRSLLESGGLEARRTWALTSAPPTAADGLESLLMARIAALPRDARRVAQAAAVLGRSFEPTVLARRRSGRCRANLTQLMRANVIRESRPFRTGSTPSPTASCKKPPCRR